MTSRSVPRSGMPYRWSTIIFALRSWPVFSIFSSPKMGLRMARSLSASSRSSGKGRCQVFSPLTSVRDTISAVIGAEEVVSR